mmetsp:Transcript_60203/g.183893  ORF Transcript_60203/g.183893 Transcript_60203/m.183893 type:complete len:262 (-) Transcript_60203:470-1255(-)
MLRNSPSSGHNCAADRSSQSAAAIRSRGTPASRSNLSCNPAVIWSQSVLLPAASASAYAAWVASEWRTASSCRRSALSSPKPPRPAARKASCCSSQLEAARPSALDPVDKFKFMMERAVATSPRRTLCGCRPDSASPSSSLARLVASWLRWRLASSRNASMSIVSISSSAGCIARATWRLRSSMLTAPVIRVERISRPSSPLMVTRALRRARRSLSSRPDVSWYMPPRSRNTKKIVDSVEIQACQSIWPSSNWRLPNTSLC